MPSQANLHQNPSKNFARKHRKTVLFAVTAGNLLEWYEIYLFTYWAPTIAQLFFPPGPEYKNLLHAFLLFFLGFLARPIGGVFFGYLGDRIGRKKALIISILLMVIPTFLIGLLPTYNQIGTLSIWSLGILRIMQSFPAGGEVPGAACYLYECVDYSERKYLTSWTGVGVQIGIILATIESFLVDRIFDPEDLLDWGWRVSFFSAGCIGICGLLLRSKLHETTLFQELHSHKGKIIPDSLINGIRKNLPGIAKSALYCFMVSPAFYFISVNFASYFHYNIDKKVLTIIFLLLVTVPVPLIGKMTKYFDLKKMILSATGIVIFLTFPLYYSINNDLTLLFAFCSFIFCMCIACVTALSPYIVCDVFPTRFRFTGVAIGYNLVDGIIGGITPAATLFLLKNSGDQGSFCWILLLCSVVSFIAFLFIREHHKPASE